MKKDNVILIGMPGSGKSTVGVLLAKELGCGFIDTDLILQRQEGRRLEEILRDKGIEEFLDIEGRVCEALDAEQTVVATGGSVVYREVAMRHLQELGAVVYLRVALDDLAARLNDMKGRGVALREGQTLADLYRERTVLYEKYAELTVSEDGQTMEDTVAAVKEALSRR